MNNEFIKRTISSIVLISLIIIIISSGIVIFNFFLLICLFISVKEWLVLCKNKINRLLGILFLIISFYSAYSLKLNYDNYSYFILILIICISTDLGGYLFGKIFKGPKLTKISPNKTYIGVFGSFFISILFLLIFLKLDLLSKNIIFSNKIFIFTILISAASQIGDLIISYFKRISKIKDTGSIIPGHGGLLDRIDGMIFAFPFSYFLISNNILI